MSKKPGKFKQAIINFASKKMMQSLQKQQMVKMINDALQKVNKHLENTEQLSGDLLKEFMNKFKNNITKNQNTPSCIELSMKNSLFDCITVEKNRESIKNVKNFIMFESNDLNMKNTIECLQKNNVGLGSLNDSYDKLVGISLNNEQNVQSLLTYFVNKNENSSNVLIVPQSIKQNKFFDLFQTLHNAKLIFNSHDMPDFDYSKLKNGGYIVVSESTTLSNLLNILKKLNGNAVNSKGMFSSSHTLFKNICKDSWYAILNTNMELSNQTLYNMIFHNWEMNELNARILSKNDSQNTSYKDMSSKKINNAYQNMQNSLDHGTMQQMMNQLKNMDKNELSSMLDQNKDLFPASMSKEQILSMVESFDMNTIRKEKQAFDQTDNRDLNQVASMLKNMDEAQLQQIIDMDTSGMLKNVSAQQLKIMLTSFDPAMLKSLPPEMLEQFYGMFQK